jgi:hypothetical protein
MSYNFFRYYDNLFSWLKLSLLCESFLDYGTLFVDKGGLAYLGATLLPYLFSRPTLPLEP